MDALCQPSGCFRMVANLKGSMGQRNNGSGIGLQQVDIKNASNLSSLVSPAYYADFNQAADGKEVRDDNKNINVSTSLDLQYEPIKGLRFSNLFTYNIITGSSSKFSPSFINDNIPEYYGYNDKTYNLYDRAAINYIRSIGNHNLNFFAFNEVSSYGFRANASLLTQTANDQIEGPVGYSWYRSKGGTLDNAKDTRIHGFGGSIPYNYDTKYVIDISYRLDGTSTNGPSTGYTVRTRLSAPAGTSTARISCQTCPGLAMDRSAVAGVAILYQQAASSMCSVPIASVTTTTTTQRYTSTGVIFPTMPSSRSHKTKFNLGYRPRLVQQCNQATVIEPYYETTDNEVMDVRLANVNGFTKIKSNARSVVNYGIDASLTWRVVATGKPCTVDSFWKYSMGESHTPDASCPMVNAKRSSHSPIDNAAKRRPRLSPG